MPYRRLRVTTPDLGAFYSIVDDEYKPHELASNWLRSCYFAGWHAESTSAEYASSIALYLTWTGRRGPRGSRPTPAPVRRLPECGRHRVRKPAWTPA